jgi:hypothetical protein
MNYAVIARNDCTFFLLCIIINICSAQVDNSKKIFFYLPSISINNNVSEYRNIGFPANVTNYNIGLNILHTNRKIIYKISIYSLINSYNSKTKGHEYNCIKCLFRQTPFIDNYIGNVSALYRISKFKLYIEGAIQGSILSRTYNPRISIWGSIPNEMQARTLSVFLGARKICTVKSFEFQLKMLPFYGKLWDEHKFNNYNNIFRRNRYGLIIELEIMLNLYKNFINRSSYW